jgi:polysaccharide transporter, PST family
MSSSCCTNPVSRVGDNFALGVFVMLALSIVQRSVGLLRSLGFCHFLSDVELGQWALTNSFFVIGVPLAVLGLPGVFGKFSEYYRSRGQLSEFCSRVAWASGLALAISCGLLLTFANQFAWLIYGESKPIQVIGACVLAFAAAAAFSFINELASSLRLVRVVSMMQFIQSLLFAILGVAGIAYLRSWQVLLPAFAVASIVGLLPGVWALWQQHGNELGGPAFQMPHRTLSNQELGIWHRILPYAGTLWLLNFLGNMFEVTDRYMLLHLNPISEATGQALVGQYHAGYILPNLLTSLSMMLSGVLLPYLSADWELGRHEQIGQRMRQMLISMSLGYMTLAVGALSVAPILYKLAFGGRYELAVSVLPMTMMQATWFSLYFVCQSYMLCAERGRLLTGILACGLAVNLGLNWFLIQAFGLPGALVATATSNFCVLCFLLWWLKRSRINLGWGTTLLCLSTGAMAAGAIAAACVLVACTFLAGRTDWLLSQCDRQAIDGAIIPRLKRLGLALDSIWP